MKFPQRPFVVEIKRRGRRLAAAAKASIWPDPSVFREPDETSDEPRPAGTTAADDVDNAAPPTSVDAAIGPEEGTGDKPVATSAETIATRDQSPRPASKPRRPKITSATLPVEQAPEPLSIYGETPADHGDDDGLDGGPVGERQPPRRKARRWSRKDTPVFRAGEPWKRRLPRILW